jgi:hypothetical protein
MKSRYNPWPDEEEIGRPRTWWPMIIAVLVIASLIAALIIGVERENARRGSASATALGHAGGTHSVAD